MFFRPLSVFFCAAALFVSASCNSETKNEPGKTSNPPSANYLSMKINGKVWQGNQEIFGAFHPKGYNNAILISGERFEKDDSQEQNFNINLYNASGAGEFTFENGNADNNVVQLSNVSEQNYMYGSMMGFNMRVNILKANANPVLIEATFEGELKGNSGDKLTITEGKFYYHEQVQ